MPASSASSRAAASSSVSSGVLNPPGSAHDAGVRLAVALDQHDVQVALDDGEHDDVDGDGERPGSRAMS